MADFKIIETQEQLDNIIKDRLDRKEKAVREEYEKYSDYDQLKTQNEELTKKLADFDGKKVVDLEEFEKLNKTVKKYETDSVKTRIAKKFNLPDELATRLTGEDEETLEKDAEELASIVSKSTNPQTLPLASTEGNGGNKEDDAINRQMKKLRGEKE